MDNTHTAQTGSSNGYSRTSDIRTLPVSATWAKAEAADAPAITRTRSPARSIVGDRVELARYTVSSGERILYGQRVDGVVRVSDRPAVGEGRSYLVERELELDGNSALKALIADYVLCGYPHSKYYADALAMPIAA